jgi:phospholipid/cholesterol/gamma-HCH transport system permease protein
MATQTGKPVRTRRGGPELAFGRVEAGVLRLCLAGDWKLKTGLPTSAAVERQLESDDGLRRLTLDASDLGDWDSGLLAFLVGIEELARTREIELDPGDLPEGARRLLRLATAVPERQGARRTQGRPDFLTLIGTECLALWQAGAAMLEFIGQAVQSFGRLVIGRARFRRSDLVDIIYECGAAALPIITLISFLVGLILAFVGAVQLQQFGAQIYVADLSASQWRARWAP